MRLEFEPDAAKNFNRKAEALLSAFAAKPELYRNNQRRGGSYAPDVYVSGHFTDADIIGDFEITTTDVNGTPILKFIDDGEKLVGLSQEDYKGLRRLAEEMHRTKGFYSFVSLELVSGTILYWLRDKSRKLTTLSLTDYLTEKCKEKIKDIELWLPIAMTHIQPELKIGKIIFKSISSEMIDEWYEEGRKKQPENADKLQNFWNIKRKKLQGFAAATMKLAAKPKRAYEIAYEEAEKALSLLRFFSPANLIPKVVSYCTLLGKEHIDANTYLVMHNNMLLTMSEFILDRNSRPWILNSNDILEMRSQGLDILDKLLEENRRTEFQEKVLDALLIYSKSALAKDLSDKLIYQLVALESMLLKNENVPILQNISERIAFSIGDTVAERKSIIESIKKVYGLRSKFVHHGQTVEDLDSLKKFMFNAWIFFLMLIKRTNQFAKQSQFIDWIENIKLSGAKS